MSRTHYHTEGVLSRRFADCLGAHTFAADRVSPLGLPSPFSSGVATEGARPLRRVVDFKDEAYTFEKAPASGSPSKAAAS